MNFFHSISDRYLCGLFYLKKRYAHPEMHLEHPLESQDVNLPLDGFKGFSYSVANKTAREGGKEAIMATKRNKTVRGNTIHVKTKLIDTFIKMKIGGFSDAELKAIGDKISEIVAQNDPR